MSFKLFLRQENKAICQRMQNMRLPKKSKVL
ncbi:UNVERIFIED_CONTAM: hypothetical protein GTU68_025355 [Idotea baltica]|nr:hypothetical protein [Idotea baltica]